MIVIQDKTTHIRSAFSQAVKSIVDRFGGHKICAHHQQRSIYHSCQGFCIRSSQHRRCIQYDIIHLRTKMLQQLGELAVVQQLGNTPAEILANTQKYAMLLAFNETG